MANRAHGQAIRQIGLLGALAGLLLGCSGGGTHHAAGLPDPAPGKVAAFDLNTLSSRYNLNRVVSDIPLSSFIASDRTDDAYLLDSEKDASPDILRLTSHGTVTRFAPVPSGEISGMTVTAPGVLAIGRQDALVQVTAHGATPLTTGHTFTDAVPIGVRPDRSIVVLDAGRAWSVNNGHTTALAGTAGQGHGIGTVDASGTAYVLLTGLTIGNMLVIPPGKTPHTLQVSGNLPGTSTPISTLDLRTIAPDGSDGFYAMADSGETTSYLVHIHGTKAEILAKSPIRANGPDSACRSGRQFPALDNPCSMPWRPVPLTDRVLLLGQTAGVGYAQTPSLAIHAAAAR